ncbi:MAG: flagellar export chaperone FliS [Rubrivivax sp.]
MMTASPFASGSTRAAGHLYRKVAVESQIDGNAGSHRLVAMLFEGLFESIAQARGAIRAGDTATKCRALTRAAAIIEEGLRAALDLRHGGQLARDLHELYAYVTLRLTWANLHSDEAVLDECVNLMQPLADAWASINPDTATRT